MTTYYTVTGNPQDLNRGSSALVRNEFLLIQTAFASVDSTFTTYTGLLATKGNVAGQVWTGTHDYTGASITVPTQAAGNNTNFAASTAYVVATVNAASGVTLPVQTGNNGKVLFTNGTTPYWDKLSYVGATSPSGSVTLTSSSTCVQAITTSNWGQTVTLPNATTVTAGGILFVIRNVGDYDLGVVDAAGNKLGWIKPREVSMVGCSDISTSAGAWTLTNIEKVGLTAQFFNSTLGAGTLTQRVAIDSNRTLFLVLATNLYGVIYDAANLSWGSLTLIRNSVSFAACCLSAANQVLVASCSSTTAFEAVTLTISSNTMITPNTPATAVLGGNIASMNRTSILGEQGIVQMGSGGTTIFVCSYGRAATVCASRGMTISGTAVTIGTELVHTPTVTTPPLIFSANSTLGFGFVGDATNIHVMPYTWSGANLAAGTNATKAGTSTQNKCFPLGSGNFGCLYNNATLFGGVISFTGSVATFNSLSVINQSITSPLTAADISVVSTTKVLVTTVASNVIYSNHLIDTAGAASAGTQVTFAETTTVSPFVVNTTGNNVRMVTAIGSQITLDCSGTSPVISIILASASSVALFVSGFVTSQYGYKGANVLNSGATSIAFSLNADLQRITYSTNSMVLGKLSFQGIVSAVVGNTANETFGYSTQANKLLIQRLECAA